MRPPRRPDASTLRWVDAASPDPGWGQVSILGEDEGVVFAELSLVADFELQIEGIVLSTDDVGEGSGGGERVQTSWSISTELNVGVLDLERVLLLSGCKFLNSIGGRSSFLEGGVEG